MKEDIKRFFKNKTNDLFILVVVSFIVLPITYSRFVTNSETGIRTPLATWDVDVLPDVANPEVLELVSKNVSSASYALNVTSESNVASIYSLVITDIPSSITVSVDDGSVLTPSGGEIRINNLGSFSANSANKTKQHILTFYSSTDTLVGSYQVKLNVVVKQRLEVDG